MTHSPLEHSYQEHDKIEKLLLRPIHEFLHCATPENWIIEAIKPENLPTLLIDHANCELKAAQTAMWLIRKYAANEQSSTELLAWLKPYEDYVYRKVGNGDFSQYATLSKKLVSRSDFEFGDELIDKMVMLIKEELHHFQQVCEFLQAYDLPYNSLSAARYAKGMMREVRSHEPATLIDKLICGAYIEARSCERFAKLAPYLSDDLNDFYVSLLRSESRHFQDYLGLAEKIAGHSIAERVQYFGKVEARLISEPDEQFRFHSGPNV